MNTHNLFSIPLLKPVWSFSPLKVKDRPVIKSSKDVFEIVFPIFPEVDIYESFFTLLLSRNNRVLGLAHISTGSVAGTVADPKKIFQHGLLANASGIVLIHNHPSGNLIPSAQDHRITSKCKDVGLALDMPVMDHIIISSFGEYFSFADNQLL